MQNLKLFLIIPPGLEDLAHLEMVQKLPSVESNILKGGIEVSADMDWMVNAHLLLKIPVRILLRITEFKVRDFPKLHQKFLKFPWKDYLCHPEPEWEITSRKSRLLHTGRIEETIKKALTEALVRQPLSQDWKKKNYTPQTFYVRIEDDNLTFSLDLSGAPLYKRNLQTIKGEAPLRENIAAALVFELLKDQKEEITLYDPMCGSGTFLLEARHFHLPLHERKFSFEEAPFFKGKLVKMPAPTKSLAVKKFIGTDINKEIIQKTALTFSEMNIEVKNSDALETEYPDGFIICNPPYGERIKIQGKRGLFLKSAWKKFMETDRPVRFGWLLPGDMDDLFNAPKNYTLMNKRRFRNGGLAVTYWIWQREQN